MAKTKYSVNAPTVLVGNPKPSDYAISQAQMTSFIFNRGSTSTGKSAPFLYYYPKVNGVYDTVKKSYSVSDLVGFYYKYAELESVDAVVLLCQAIHETGWFAFGGETKVYDNNYCGLQIGGVSVRIDTPELGVMAHVQHMALYGRKGNPIFLIEKYDPKYDAVANDPARKGMGPTVALLSALWATDGKYAEKMGALLGTYNSYVSSLGETAVSTDLGPFRSITTTSSNTRKKIVILDPGHGTNTGGKRVPSGPEYGAAAGMHEYTFNSNVADRIKTSLRNIPVTPSFELLVFDTRHEQISSEDDVALEKRTKYANSLYQQYSGNADIIYLSIHANAGGGTGIETIYPVLKNGQENTDTSKYLAEQIHAPMMSYIIANYGATKDRGTKNDMNASGVHLWVLKESKMPSILFELGFMDSTTECLRLIDDKYRQVCADAIVGAVLKYFGNSLSSQEISGLSTKNNYEATGGIFATSSNYTGYNKTSITEVLGNGLAKKIIGEDLKTMQQLTDITGISVAMLKEMNGLSSNTLYPGQVIYYPTSDKSTANDIVLSEDNMISYIDSQNRMYLNFSNYADSRVSLADAELTGYEQIGTFQEMGLISKDPKERLKVARQSIKARAPVYPGYSRSQIIINTPTGDKKIEFLIGPNQYSIVRSNKINFEETLGGWNVIKSGRNLTRLSMTGKLMDSESLLENHAFIEDYKRYIEDHVNDKNEYENLNSVKILLEGREYYGYITDIQTSKSTTSMSTFDYSISFVSVYDEYKYKTDSVDIYDPNSNTFSTRSIIDFKLGPDKVAETVTVTNDIITVDSNGNQIAEPVLNILSGTPENNNTPTMSAKVTVKTHLNVRNGPATTFAIVGKKNNGDIIQILETDPSTGWYRIGTDQWVTNDSNYVKIIENTVVQSSVVAVTYKTAEIYNCTMLNVRALPNSNKTTKIVRVLNAGNKVTVYATDNGWYKISEYASEWIYSKFARYI